MVSFPKAVFSYILYEVTGQGLKLGSSSKQKKTNKKNVLEAKNKSLHLQGQRLCCLFLFSLNHLALNNCIEQASGITLCKLAYIKFLTQSELMPPGSFCDKRFNTTRVTFSWLDYLAYTICLAPLFCLVCLQQKQGLCCLGAIPTAQAIPSAIA